VEPSEQIAAMEKLQKLIDEEQRLISELDSVRSSIAEFWCNLRLGPSKAMTPREMDVFRLLRKRMGNKGIGHELNLAESTVKYHVSNILKKFKVQSRYDL
jgi:DNA-binding NarL/FixJ family response regulator